LIDVAIWERGYSGWSKDAPAARLFLIGYAVAEEQVAAPERCIFWEGRGDMRLAAFRRRTWPAASRMAAVGGSGGQRHGNFVV